MSWEGGDDLKDSLEYMELVLGGASSKKVQELNDLMSRQPIGRTMGPIADKSLTLLDYWDQQMPETQVKIENVWRPFKYPPTQ